MTPEIPGRYWCIGAIAAFLAHAVIAASMLWQPADPGARRAGVGGIEVSLGPGGSAPGSVASPKTSDVEAVEPADVAPETRPERAQDPEPESVAVRSVPDAAGEIALAAKTPHLEAEAAEPVETHIVKDVQPPDGRAETKPDRVEAVQRPRDAKATDEAGMEEPVAASQTTTREIEPDETRVTEAMPSAPGLQGRAGTSDEERTGNASEAQRGGIPGVSPDYLAVLRGWLEKHKRYPLRARRLRQEGTALLYFVMDRHGRVLEYRIRRSSGHRVLDEEVTAMIERAQPLPGIPTDADHETLELVVPVQFSLL